MYYLCLTLTLTVKLHLHWGRRWPIVCTPSGAFLNRQKEFIPRELHSMLPALTYTQFYTRLPMEHLIQVPEGLPDTVTRTEVST